MPHYIIEMPEGWDSVHCWSSTDCQHCKKTTPICPLSKAVKAVEVTETINGVINTLSDSCGSTVFDKSGKPVKLWATETEDLK